jgi:hypothetical protein
MHFSPDPETSFIYSPFALNIQLSSYAYAISTGK